MAALRRVFNRVKTLIYKYPDNLPKGGRNLPAAFQEGKNVDAQTHTGQDWAADDFRRLRFFYKDKQVNDRFAIDLIAEDPIVVVNQRFVWSSSGGALGHPKVYINLDKNEVGVCGYSGRKFIQKQYYKETEHGPSITYEEYLKQMQTGNF